MAVKYFSSTVSPYSETAFNNSRDQKLHQQRKTGNFNSRNEIHIRGCCASFSSSQPKQMRQIQAIHCFAFQTGFIDFYKFGAIMHDIFNQNCTRGLIVFIVFLCERAWKLTRKFNFILLPGQAKCLILLQVQSLTMASCRCFKNKASRDQIFWWKGTTRNFIGQR